MMSFVLAYVRAFYIQPTFKTQSHRHKKQLLLLLPFKLPNTILNSALKLKKTKAI